MKKTRTYLKIFYGLAFLGLLSCDGLFGPESGIARIEVTPSSLVVSAPGSTVEFTAIARDNAGDAIVPQPTFSWLSDNRTVATIASTGPATALATVVDCRSGECGTCTSIIARADSREGQSHIALPGSLEAHPCPPR